jgi:hypothetical protein
MPHTAPAATVGRHGGAAKRGTRWWQRFNISANTPTRGGFPWNLRPNIVNELADLADIEPARQLLRDTLTQSRVGRSSWSSRSGAI